MKTVFSSHSDVCHAFNLQNQIRGRASSIFFESNKIYSYGRHYLLGEFIAPNTILINNKGYSNSTEKHISILRSATRDRRQIFTRDIELNLVLNELERAYIDLMKARKPENYFMRIRYVYECFRSNKEYLNGFYLENGYLEGFRFVRLYEASLDDEKKLKRIEEIHILAHKYSSSEKYLNKVKRAAELDAIKAEKEREKREERKRELERTKAERIERFYNSEASIVLGLEFDLLRVSKCGQYVETSQAVRIPKKEAQRYFTLFNRGIDLRGEKIGQFTTRSNADNILQIGCHKIKHDEVNRIGQLLNA